MPSPRQEVAWGGALVVVFLLGLVLMLPPASLVPTDQRLSTYRASPDGAAALFQTMAELDLRVERRLTPLRGADPVRGALAVLAPTEPLTPGEIDDLIDWIEAGGRLLLVGGPFDSLLRELGLRVGRADRTAPSLTTAADHPWLRNVEIEVAAQYNFRDGYEDAWSEVSVLLEAEEGGGAAVLLARRGGGEVLALSDPRLVTNATIAGTGIAPLLVRAATAWTAGGDTLWFSEFHHGHRGGSLRAGGAAFLGGHPAGQATLYLALIALLAIAASAIRFGRPVRLEAQPRRSPVEHVAALGEAYRLGRARSVARRRLIVGFARRIGRERPAAGEEEMFLKRIEQRVPTGREAVADVSVAWREEMAVLELARRIDRAVERLNGDR